MARPKRKRNRSNLKLALDATPERLSKGDDSDFVNPAEIDSFEQPIGRVRRFRCSHIDRMHRNDMITLSQYYAGNWFRETHYRAANSPSVTASWAEKTSGGELPTVFGYGLPKVKAQIKARELLRSARLQWPKDMRGFMERLLIHNELPRYGGRAAMRNLNQIRRSLDMLSEWLNRQ